LLGVEVVLEIALVDIISQNLESLDAKSGNIRKCRARDGYPELLFKILRTNEEIVLADKCLNATFGGKRISV
jgi:hypothetical protein